MKRTALILLLAATAVSRAAVINYAGFVEDTTVNDWRTVSTAKPMDLDGDNFYGTHGAVQWTRAGINQEGVGSPNPGWAYLGEVGAGQFSNPQYAQVDDVLNPALNYGGGIAAVGAPGTFTFELTGNAGTYAGKAVRVGVMADILSSAEWAADVGKTFTLEQVVGGSSSSGTISLRGGGAGNGQPEMYFFDITGVNPGDRFRISAGNSGGQLGYIGPMSWDLYTPVPEPSAALLGGLALLSFTRRRRA